MVGVDKQKNSEDLVSMCCVYSEAIIVRGQENYSFFFIKGINKDLCRGGRTWLVFVSRQSFTNKCTSPSFKNKAKKKKTFCNLNFSP